MDIGRSLATAPVRRAWRRAKIVFNNKSSVIDCSVRVLQTHGAELVMTSTIAVPAEFELRIEPTGERHFCEVTSRSRTELAVAFVGAATAPASTKRKPPSPFHY